MWRCRMKMVGVVVAVAALSLPQVAAAQYKGQHTGLPLIDHPWARPGQYVENISEEAYGAVFSMAAILSGGSVLRVEATPQGGTFQTLGSNPCFLSAATEEERERNRICRESIEARRKAWMTFLRAHADRDRSGFVTTEEGAAIYLQVQTASYVSQLHLRSVESLQKLGEYRGMTKATIVARLAAYAALREEALKDNLVGMPALPAPLLRESTVARIMVPGTQIAGTSRH
jgi:hypothetical protein